MRENNIGELLLYIWRNLSLKKKLMLVFLLLYALLIEVLIIYVIYTLFTFW